MEDAQCIAERAEQIVEEMAGRQEETVLYRHFNRSGQLIYVGVSLSVLQRLNQHKESHWWREISQVTFERFNSRTAALVAEQIAIKEEKPFYNIVGKENLIEDITRYGPNCPPPWDAIEDCTQWQCADAADLDDE